MVLQRLTERKEWKFFAVLPKADRGLAAAWWASLLLRGILPAVFAVVQRKAKVEPASLDPDDPNSSFYDEDKVRLFEEGA